MSGPAGLRGRAGIWTRQFDAQPAAAAQAAAAELEALGCGTVWIPEAALREVTSHAAVLLAGTSDLVIATGIANVHLRTARTLALAERILLEAHPGRFLLGLGVSHAAVVERRHGLTFGSPLATMASYLDGLDEAWAEPHPVPAATAPVRVLAALGPRMLALAAERTAGAHTYLSPVEHTAWARERLGPGPLLAPAIKAVLRRPGGGPSDVARASVRGPMRLPAYRANLERLGFTQADLADGGSDRLVDALVVEGDEAAIVARVQAHLDAGADHVGVEVLTGDDTTLPMEAWRALVPALRSLDPSTS